MTMIYPILDFVPTEALTVALSKRYVQSEEGYGCDGLCFWGVLLNNAGCKVSNYPASEEVLAAMKSLGWVHSEAGGFDILDPIIYIASANDDGELQTSAGLRNMLWCYSSKHRFADFPCLFEGEPTVAQEGDFF